MRKSLILLNLFAICMLNAVAQNEREYIFNHLDKYDGLASSNVISTTQDKNGYIWLGTSRGLYRYDGTHLKNFTVLGDSDAAFPSDGVLQVMIDRYNNIWLRFVGEKVGVLNPITGKFRTVPIDREPIPNKGGIAKIVTDKEGHVIFMVATEAIYTYDAKTDEFSRKNNFISLPVGWRPSGIDYDSTNDTYWIGCHEGLAKYNTRTKTLSYTGNNVEKEWVLEDSIHQHAVLNVIRDTKNRTWVVSWPGPPIMKLKLICHDPVSKTRRQYDLQLDSLVGGYYEITGLTVQRNGSVWLYGMPFLGHLNEETGNFQFINSKYTNRYSIEFNHVHSVYNDIEENLWVSTDLGSYVFNPEAQVFRRVKNHLANGEIKENSVNDILYTQNGQIWVATWGEGIFMYDKNFNPIKGSHEINRKIGSFMVWDITQRKNGDIWIGGQDGLLSVYNPTTGNVISSRAKIFNGRTVRQLYQDNSGKIWLGTQGGRVIRWDPEKAKTNFEDGFTLMHDLEYVINSFNIDSKGFLWICADVIGLFKLDPATGRILEHYRYTNGKEKSLFSPGASDIIEIDDSLLMVMNRGISVLNRNTGTFRHISELEGLYANNVHSAVQDKKGFFWLLTDEGVLRYNFEKNIITAPSHEEGYVETKMILSAAATLPDGRIVMGTEHDVFVLDPDKTFPDLEVPPVRITDFQIGSTFLSADSLMEQKHINIEYGKTSFAIYYAAISQLQKSQLRYYYKLEGLDKDWILGDRQQKAQYSFLPSGHYVFKIKAVNAYGNSSEESSFKIYVAPPFWRAPWFYAILVLIASILVYQYYKSTIQRRRNEEEIRNRIATNLHENLSATLANVNVLGEMAKMKIDRDAEGAREYISKITRTTSSSMEAMDDILWCINPDNDSMLKMAERMKKIANEMLGLKNIAYNFNIDETVLRMRMGMQDRNGLLNIYKSIIKEVAENSQCYQVNIEFHRNNGYLHLSVEDDGKGFNLEDAEVKKRIDDFNRRVQAIRGKVDVQSQLGKGTRVVLRFET
jgi:ligand-binding sensor domain-containing protein